MITAGHLFLSVLSSLLVLAAGLELLSQDNVCSTVVAGVLYGSFSLKDVFPKIAAGCSWTLENPDPTKYSLYFKFNREEHACLHFSPMVLLLDHYLSNHTCTQLDYIDYEGVELCESRAPVTFLQFDKNFVQLCLTREPEDVPFLAEETLEFHLVEVLLINNENSSQFTCGILCRWFEECLRSNRKSEHCGITQTGCICPEVLPPPPPLSVTRQNESVSNVILPPPSSDCCVTELHSTNANNIAPRDARQDHDVDEEQKVKTQRPRSADQPGTFQAQTGDPAAEEWSQWSVCSLTCGQGWQVRTRSCVSSPYGTLCSGPLRETRLCNNTATCPADGKWGNWNHWSLCSKTCDTGWQQRFRMCQGTGEQGYPCEGSGEEVRTCNDKKCPGSASRRCLLDTNGVAYWGPPSFARCISHEYRYLHLSKLYKSSEEVKVNTGEEGHFYFKAKILLTPSESKANRPSVTRVCLPVPPPQLREHLAKGQRTLAGEGMSQVVRSLLELMSRKSYYSGDLLFSVEILRNVTDTFKRATYIPAADDIQRFFQVVSLMLDVANREKWDDAQQFNAGSLSTVISIQREPVTAVSSDIHFPTKGRRGMKDWARSSEDKLFIPKEVFTLASSESDEASYFVIGAILYRTLGRILPAPKSPLVVSSKVLTVTVRPLPKPQEPLVVVELSPVLNAMGPSGVPSVPLMIGCAISCTALLILLAVYAAFWRYIKSERSIILLNFCLSILASNILILVGQSQTLSRGVCTMTAAFLHFFFLSSFCWVLTEAWQSYLAVIGKIRTRLIRKRFLCLGWGEEKTRLALFLMYLFTVALVKDPLYNVQSQLGVCTMTAAFLHFFFLSSFCWVLTEAWQSYLAVIGKIRTRLIRKRFLCLGWGLPALIVAVSVGFTRARGYGTASYCWLSLEGGLLYAFVGPAAVIVLVNMLIGIVVFNKLMSRDGISDKSKKQRAGASLWSSCVVLPLLALTWMSAVLAMTDRRSVLFQVLFAVFDSVQGFVIIAVHCALRREVQDAVKSRMGICKSEESENSPDSCKNGQAQIMVSPLPTTHPHRRARPIAPGERLHTQGELQLWERVIFKEVNTCNPSTITGTLSRISLDDDEDPKLHTNTGGLHFSSLPGNIPPPNILVQVPQMTGLNELKEQTLKKDMNLDPRGPVYLCTDNHLRSMELNWARPQEASSEGDYMVLPRRTVSLKPFSKDEGKPLNIKMEHPTQPALAHRPAEKDMYPNFVSVDHINMNLNQSYGTLKHPHGLQFKQHPSVRQILASELGDKSRTMPRSKGSPNLTGGSLEVLKLADMSHKPLTVNPDHSRTQECCGGTQV
ncbi:UNVERIFIED_CONTAM: hypothetical protein FKN15_069311 [Acipenser sinensis]